jgi:hypothetical protein
MKESKQSASMFFLLFSILALTQPSIPLISGLNHSDEAIDEALSNDGYLSYQQYITLINPNASWRFAAGEISTLQCVMDKVLLLRLYCCLRYLPI